MLEGQKIGTYRSQRDHDFRLMRNGEDISVHERHQGGIVGMESKQEYRFFNDWKGSG